MMGIGEKFKSMHLDVLREIGNIGAGNAATALSIVVGKKIEMKVPTVGIIPFDEMLEMAGGQENVVAAVYLRVEGDAPGSMFFILPLEQGTSYVKKMTGAIRLFHLNIPHILNLVFRQCKSLEILS